MTDTAWYLVALLPLVGLAGAHTAVDRWLFSQPRPLRGPAMGVLAARWGFLAAVLVYAWLIDSHRVPYSEPGIWALFGAGLLLTVGLVAAVVLLPRRRRKRSKRGKKGKCK
jgi:hypothetical protein